MPSIILVSRKRELCAAMKYQLSPVFILGVGSVSDTISLYPSKNAQPATHYPAALNSDAQVSLHLRPFRICYLSAEIIEILVD